MSGFKVIPTAVTAHQLLAKAHLDEGAALFDQGKPVNNEVWLIRNLLNPPLDVISVAQK